MQSAGQRCSACRVVCVQEDVADRFLEMLEGAMAELAVGDPSKLSTDVGPVIDDEAREMIGGHLARLDGEARLIARAPTAQNGADGTFVAPSAYEINALADLKTEIFGPVLHVLRFSGKGLDALVDGVNGLGYGLTMGVHTRIDETMHAVARRARVGNLYVNRNQIGAVVGVQPFGGEGLSGTGPKAGGPHYLNALVKRDRPQDGARGCEIIASGLSLEEQAAINAAASACHDWCNADRGAELARAADAAKDAGPALEGAAALYREAFQTNVELPGPTGEANTLKLRGRGIVLCLGGDSQDAFYRQIALALAAGNCVIACHPYAADVADALQAAGAPKGVFQNVDSPISAALIKDDRVRAVIFDGGAKGRAAAEAALAEREGPIAPLLSSRDAPWRFAAERTLTVNTTAAGGDVRLLSLGE